MGGKQLGLSTKYILYLKVEGLSQNKRVDSAVCWSSLSVAALKSSFPLDDGTVVLVALTHATADVFRGI